MRTALVAALSVLAIACGSPAPGAPTPIPAQTALPTRAPVQVQAVVPQTAPSPVRPVASPSPARIPLSALAGHSGADLRATLDATLQENAYLTAAAMQAASAARLDELIGASTMLDQSTLNLAEIVGSIKGQTAAQALADAWRAQTADLITYSQAHASATPAQPDVDYQSGLIAAQLATADFSEQAAETVVRRRTQQELTLADSLANHDAGQTAQHLATLVSGSGDLSRPLSAALASQVRELSPATTEGADVEVRLRLGAGLLQHVYLRGAAIEAATDNRAADAQAYAAAAGDTADDLAAQLTGMYGAEVGNAVGDRLRGETDAVLAAASGGDRRQAGEDLEQLRGQIDALLSGANPLLAPGLLAQQLRAEDQPLLTATVAFQNRDFATAYARLHEAAHQSQKPALTLALAIVDRYPGRYLMLPTPARGLRQNSTSGSRGSSSTGSSPSGSTTSGIGPDVGPHVGPRVGPFGGRH